MLNESLEQPNALTIPLSHVESVRKSIGRANAGVEGNNLTGDPTPHDAYRSQESVTTPMLRQVIATAVWYTIDCAPFVTATQP